MCRELSFQHHGGHNALHHHHHGHHHGHHQAPSPRDVLRGKFVSAVGRAGLDPRHASWMMRSFDHLNVTPGNCSVRIVQTNFRLSIILDTPVSSYTWDVSSVDGRWRWM